MRSLPQSETHIKRSIAIWQNKLQIQLIKTVCVLSRYYPIPEDIAIKTYDYYLRTISGYVRDLYRSDITEGEFVTAMADLIQAQLTRAWNEGMRENDLDPQSDMEPEWQEILDAFILDEYNYVDSFAADIVAYSKEMGGYEEAWEPLLSRAELWANRYNDVLTKSIITTKEQKLIWIYGDTDHCDNCLYLNGIVAFASEWEESGIRPQSSDLECGGFRCQCQLIPTSNRHTTNALDAIRDAMAARSLKGGPGSGNFGHAGRPGEVGGSGSGGGGGDGGNGGGDGGGGSPGESSGSESSGGDKLKEPNLNGEELQALHDYSGDFHRDINNHYRNGYSINELEQSVSNRMDKILEDHNIDIDVIAYRGSEFYKETADDIVDMRSDLFQPGTVFMDKGFVSSSIDLNQASGFSGLVAPTEFTIKIPAGSHGVYIGKLSSRPYEKEFLLPRNSKFRVVNIIKDGNEITDAWHVELELMK